MLDDHDINQVFDSMPCGVVVASTTADGVILLVNKGFTEITGYTHEDVPTVGAWLSKAYPDDEYRALVVRNWQRDVSDPGRDVFYRVRCQDGTDKELLLRAGLLSHERMIVTLLDMSEMRGVEQDLRESEERFQRFTQTVDQVFWIHRIQPLQMEYASPAFETIWGRPVDALYADPHQWWTPIVEEDVPAVMAQWDRALADEVETVDFAYRIRRPDGELRWIEDRGSAVRGEDGRVVRIIGIAKDVTDRKRAEEESRRLAERMQFAQKMESLGVLAGGVAHDFNNLLVGILGNAELALNDLSPESPTRARIRGIELAARRAADLAGQMLAYSGKGSFVIDLVDLRNLVAESTQLVEASISKKAELRCDLADDTPLIEADGTQIHQVLMNLLANASDALGEHCGLITINTGAMQCDRALLAKAYGNGELSPGRYSFLEVSDTGAGMNEQTLQCIFDPFFSTKLTGRGLGLAAVLGIVKAHHGAIQIRSEPRQGTTFRVLFPIAERQIRLREDPVPDRGKPVERTHTILLVDDEETVRTVTEEMLRRSGYTVHTAHDGRTAVSLFRDRHGEIDCVILDLTMPDMGGRETYHELRRLDPDVRVLLTSGYAERDAVRRFDHDQVAGFIQKPFRISALLEAIRHVLN